ncbi:MAG: isoprenylcysteine carboxylmethyltransferase family protein [Patescibacteria group bacterium]
MSLFGIGGILCFFALHSYWRVKDKGINKFFDFGKYPFKSLFSKSILSYTQFFILLQLFGLTIFPIPKMSANIDLPAFLFVVIGFAVCIIARHTLSKSWTNAKDFNTVQNNLLIDKGIYKYIRHPIYLGLVLMITGAEILAHSYLIVLTPLIYLWIYRHTLREEAHLISKMKQKYENYKEKTGMFIPIFHTKFT